MALDDTFCAFASARTLFDVTKYMQFCAFDIIGEITVGKSFDYLKKRTDFNGIMKALDDSSQYACRVGLFHGLHSKLAAVASTFHAPIPFDVISKYLKYHIEGRQNGTLESSREDFLTKLLRLRELGKLEDADVFTTLGANIAAGSETTGLTLSAIVYYLSRHPEHVAALRKEARHAYEAGRVSNPITYAEARDLPFLNAVIMEALRLHPATNQIMSRVVPPAGTHIAGKFFPGGTEVGVNSWVLHYDGSLFGDDCSEFRPERWLSGSEEQLRRMNRHWIPFGSGARTCIGKNISLLEITKIIPQIYRKFDFELEDPKEEWSCAGYWFVKPSFNCRVVMRDVNDRF
ncbi:hypothetical protein PV08_06934 [Exophiala spinifera]|uniref:Pisatin demethylase n=1 Tax=Exophiala spinifera TaxID=91928 RepID=A0A0D2B5G7_9EURO|nr:uncharacterized protein PV08_06934 [Exophiala spinifera]KIW14153.1 hypothetical protein PV08_06934 [Exophiala spinifera]